MVSLTVRHTCSVQMSSEVREVNEMGSSFLDAAIVDRSFQVPDILFVILAHFDIQVILEIVELFPAFPRIQALSLQHGNQ